MQLTVWWAIRTPYSFEGAHQVDSQDKVQNRTHCIPMTTTKWNPLNKKWMSPVDDCCEHQRTIVSVLFSLSTWKELYILHKPNVAYEWTKRAILTRVLDKYWISTCAWKVTACRNKSICKFSSKQPQPSRLIAYRSLQTNQLMSCTGSSQQVCIHSLWDPCSHKFSHLLQSNAPNTLEEMALPSHCLADHQQCLLWRISQQPLHHV